MTTCAKTQTRALEDLVRAHLPLVGHLVRELLGRVPAHVSRDDLVSAGMAALAGAAKSFDAGRGTPFSAFATARVRGALLDELRGLGVPGAGGAQLAAEALGVARGGLNLPLDPELLASRGKVAGWGGRRREAYLSAHAGQGPLGRRVARTPPLAAPIAA